MDPGYETPILYDIESRSRADLKRVGGRLYWADPSSEILCLVWFDTRLATDEAMRGGAEGSAAWGLWLPGDPIPDWSDRIVGAHNGMMFDRFALDRYGFRRRGDLDTSHITRRHGLPGKLDAMGIRWCGVPKDAAASRFTLSLSRSSRAKKTFGQLPEITSEKLERVVAYCCSDVGILVRSWPRARECLRALPDWEHDVVELDRKINDRGVAFDSELARRLLESDAALADAAIMKVAQAVGCSTEEARALTGTAQCTAFLGTPNAQKETIQAELKAAELAWAQDQEGAAQVVAVCEARLAQASIARGKIRAGLARVSPDGRLRDSHVYCGAHTLRWSSSGMQLHNLPRPSKRFEKFGPDEIKALAEEIRSGRRYADAEEISLLVRSLLHAPAGKRLAVCDFSGVEARCLAWMAGDRGALETFASGRNPYFVMAATVFGLRYEEMSKQRIEYNVGKIGELACLGPGARVLTDHGWKPIAKVAQRDRVWDGMAWVTHQGVISRGERWTINLEGLWLTPDHLVLAGRQWLPAGSLAANGGTLCRALATASGSLPWRAWPSARAAVCGRSWFAAHAARGARWISTIFGASDRRGVTNAPDRLAPAPGSSGGATRRSSPTRGTGAGYATESPRSSSAAITLEMQASPTMGGAGSMCTLPGGRIARRSWRTWSRWLAGMIHHWTWTVPTMREDMSQETSASSRAPSINPTGERSGSCSSESPHWSPTYDLAYAGPHNRFLVWTDRGPLIVHNCGYGMGHERLYEDYGTELDAAGVEAKTVIDTWRELHAPSVALWYEIERAAKAAAAGDPSDPVGDGLIESTGQGIQFLPGEGDDAGSIAALLPSGHTIIYPDVHLSVEASRFPNGKPRASLSYAGTKFRERTWGGSLVENVVQATCRHMLARAMLRVDAAGLPIVLDVHDEIVIEPDAAEATEAFDTLKSCMVELEPWAFGFPIGAAGFITERYCK